MIGYWYSPFYTLAKYLFFSFLLFSIADLIYLLKAGNIKIKRLLPNKLSNGDPNQISLHVYNNYPYYSSIELIDEIPVQFQKRDFKLKLRLASDTHKDTHYFLRPVKRGIYEFGVINAFVMSPLKLIKWRYIFEKPQKLKVYPSYIQMKKYELIALTKQRGGGLKKLRRLGHSLEFEQIKQYNQGDDFRTINWKATAKHNHLMVNQYQEQTSQNIYSLIDMGRTMKMPFEQMTLLDYAINSTLSFSNIVLKKHDKAGLLTFEKKRDVFIKSNHSKSTLHHLFESLYHLETSFDETDFERLYKFVNNKITTRSLLMLYTNFEHFSSFRRQLPFLKKLAKKHLLVVIIFENTEIERLINTPGMDTSTLYSKIVAEDFLRQKKRMIKEMQLHKIHAILTKPENLTITAINKYLELKKRGLI